MWRSGVPTPNRSFADGRILPKCPCSNPEHGRRFLQKGAFEPGKKFGPVRHFCRKRGNFRENTPESSAGIARILDLNAAMGKPRRTRSSRRREQLRRGGGTDAPGFAGLPSGWRFAQAISSLDSGLDSVGAPPGPLAQAGMRAGLWPSAAFDHRRSAVFKLNGDLYEVSTRTPGPDFHKSRPTWHGKNSGTTPRSSSPRPTAASFSRWKSRSIPSSSAGSSATAPKSKSSVRRSFANCSSATHGNSRRCISPILKDDGSADGKAHERKKIQIVRGQGRRFRSSHSSLIKVRLRQLHVV